MNYSLLKHSPKYNETDFTRILQIKSCFPIIDLKTRSNFGELEMFINRVNIRNTISDIYLNESCLHDHYVQHPNGVVLSVDKTFLPYVLLVCRK